MKKLTITTGILLAVVLLLTGYYGFINRNFDNGHIYENVTYKVIGDEELQLDIYMPERKIFHRIPVLVFFHGGGWSGGSKSFSESGIEAFNFIRELGFAIISVEYRLINERNAYPVPFADAADSIRWIYKHAHDYGFHANKINLVGTSAGGHIALLEGLMGGQFEGDPALASIPFQVRSIVSICGPTDLVDLAGYDDDSKKEVEQLLQSLLGGSYNEMPDLYEYASPINHIRKESPPILLSHGTNDDKVPFWQSEKFYKTAKEAGARVTFIPVRNADHKFQAPEGETTSPLVEDVLKKIFVFLMKHNL